MRLKTEKRRAIHRRLRGQCEPKRSANLAKLICATNKQASTDAALEKRGRRVRLNEARDVEIKARKAKREADAKLRAIKPEFAA